MGSRETDRLQPAPSSDSASGRRTAFPGLPRALKGQLEAAGLGRTPLPRPLSNLAAAPG